MVSFEKKVHSIDSTNDLIHKYRLGALCLANPTQGVDEVIVLVFVGLVQKLDLGLIPYYMKLLLKDFEMFVIPFEPHLQVLTVSWQA